MMCIRSVCAVPYAVELVPLFDKIDARVYINLDQVHLRDSSFSDDFFLTVRLHLEKSKKIKVVVINKVDYSKKVIVIIVNSTIKILSLKLKMLKY